MQVRAWLQGKETTNDGNFRRQRNGEDAIIGGTGKWVIRHSRFKESMDLFSQHNVV
jgi:hypothetical protein